MFKFLKRLFSRSSASEFIELAVGAYYSVRHGESQFKVAKLLAIDEVDGRLYGVHIRLYGRVFDSRPSDIRQEDLEVKVKTSDKKVGTTLGAILDKMKTGEMTFGHLPYVVEAFLGMEPEFIRQGTVAEDELDGYQVWKEDQGGYWI